MQSEFIFQVAYVNAKIFLVPISGKKKMHVLNEQSGLNLNQISDLTSILSVLKQNKHVILIRNRCYDNNEKKKELKETIQKNID